MDASYSLADLHLAEERVRECERQVAEQESLIERLPLMSAHAEDARTLLESQLFSLYLHCRQRDRIRDALASGELDSWPLQTQIE